MTMSNNNTPPRLGFDFRTPKKFTAQQQGHIAMAADNIIMHSLDIAINAEAELQETGTPSTLSPQEIEDIESRIRNVTLKELSKLIDYVTTFVPDIPAAALIAALYKEQNYIPANIDDIADDDAPEDSDFGFLLEFAESEHDKLTADYLGDLLNIEYNLPLNQNTDDKVHKTAARTEMALFIRGTMDVGANVDFKDFLDGISLNILNKTYDRGLHLANLAGGAEALNEDLQKNFTDLMETIEESIEEKMQKAMAMAMTTNPILPRP